MMQFFERLQVMKCPDCPPGALFDPTVDVPAGKAGLCPAHFRARGYPGLHKEAAHADGGRTDRQRPYHLDDGHAPSSEAVHYPGPRSAREVLCGVEGFQSPYPREVTCPRCKARLRGTKPGASPGR